MHELKFPLCTSSPSGVSPPLWARSTKSTKPSESPHRGVTSACANGHGGAQHGTCCCPGVWALSAWSSSPKVRHTEPRLKAKHACVFQAGFPCCSSHSELPDAGCDHSTTNEVMLQACSNFSAFLAQGWISLLWASSAGAQLCSSAAPASSHWPPSPLPVWNSAQSRKRKETKAVETIILELNYHPFSPATHSLWQHWPFKQIGRITARSNVK